MAKPWAKGISKIGFVPDLGSSPAQVNRVTGILTISQKWWDVLPPCHRAFILAHEMAHIQGQTTDENQADDLGFEIYKTMGYDVSCSIFALSDVLSFRNSEHTERLNNAFKRVLTYHYYNGNPIKQWQIQQILN